ncbi:MULTISPECIES: GNAT family N-acetyltransferase [Pontibacillus]|uniref:GNAT family protein n=1 Tax=Pontibacillus chungwhensis TaxID=265426 RepID=A0ABY8UVS9_9BACI|nr:MULTISPECIES: GNAT family protein [Pontibacillus]MCD5323227.1 GNAT family N-acetyltransferase [Pontibacillus sp. HN14]WIF96614.1 GNAT family protein [Pontibacillus chungwhensis]
MVTLQPFTSSDFSRLMDWIPSPDLLVQWSGSQFSFPLSEDQLEDYIHGANQDGADRFIYKINEEGKTVGHISLGRIDYVNRSARIGKVFVHESMRGKGIAPQAVEKVLQLAFEDLNLHRVTLGVFHFNTSAIQCYKRVGFQTEGLLRDHRKVGEGYWSLYEMGILEHEWKEKGMKKSAQKS